MKRIVAFILATALLASGIGCSKKEETAGEIITQTIVSPDKIPVTVLVKNAFTINTFEAAAEKVFPRLDIIQVGNYTSDMGIEEYKARMKNDDLTDIVMTWPVEVADEYWSDRLIDLSGFSFTSNYTTAMLNNISKDGALYYLPGPSQVRGILYNKTLFEENGWKMPEDFEGFIALCKQIEQTGIRALQLGLGNPEVLDTAFVGYGYDESFSKPENAQWIAGYNEGKGSFGDNFSPALATFQRLIDEGILRKSDLDIQYQHREEMMFTRQCAMVEDSVLMARMGEAYNGCTDEFALMPFFNDGPDNDWARLYPVCYIGVNKHLMESENKEKYDLVLQLLDYISTPDGQEALAGDTGAMYSSLKGVAPPDIPEIQDLLRALTHGRMAIFPTLKNAQGALREGLAKMVAGTATAQDVIKMVDAQNLNPPSSTPVPAIGTAKESFSIIETGSYISDVMREKSGCELALFLDNGKDGQQNGKGVSGRFYKGELTALDVKRVMPDLKTGDVGELWKIQMTGQDLINTLEYSIAVNNNRDGWFYYFSGLKLHFDPTAPQGSRIEEITTFEGDPIDAQKLYSIAVMDNSVPKDYIVECEKTGLLIKDVLTEAIVKAKVIEPSKDGRFTIVSSEK